MSARNQTIKMNQLTKVLPGPQLQLWLKHYRDKGYKAEIRRLNGSCAVFVEKEVWWASQEEFEYCDRHRTNNMCNYNCKNLFVLPSAIVCKIKEFLEIGEI